MIKRRKPPWETRKNYRPEQDFIVPMGKLLYWHSWLDAQLELMLLSLLGIDHLSVAQAILAHVQNFEARVDLFSQLASLRVKNKLAIVKEIHLELIDVNAKRNHIVHGRHSGFTWPPLRLGILRFRPRSQTFEMKPYFYTPEQIQDIANGMLTVGTKLGAFRWEIVSLLYDPSRDTSKETPPEQSPRAPSTVQSHDQEASTPARIISGVTSGILSVFRSCAMARQKWSINRAFQGFSTSGALWSQLHN
jgi:hypothetical protein